VNTGSATKVGVTEATVNGSFQVDPEGGKTEYYFEWGLTKTYGNKTAEQASSTVGTQQISGVLQNTTFYTLYHYRLVATDGLGTNYGSDQTLYTALPNLPVIDSTTSYGVTPDSATLEAEVNPGFGPTIYHFQYGTTSSYGLHTHSGESFASDGVDHSVSSQISGLAPDTSYHFRATATNFTGTTYGPDRTFNTTGPPSIAAIGALEVTQTTATLSAEVSPGFSATTYHFEYGIGTSYGNRTPESSSIGSDDTGHPVTVSLSGLTPATTYHYRIVATNEVGAVGSPDQTFSMATPPEEKNHARSPVCRKGHVLKHGRCVVRHERHKGKKHKRTMHHHRRGNG
jgi:hypothetical protein